MASVAASGPISFTDIQAVMGGTGPVSIEDYIQSAATGYAKGVPGIADTNVGIADRRDERIGRLHTRCGHGQNRTGRRQDTWRGVHQGTSESQIIDGSHPITLSSFLWWWNHDGKAGM